MQGLEGAFKFGDQLMQLTPRTLGGLSDENAVVTEFIEQYTREDVVTEIESFCRRTGLTENYHPDDEGDGVAVYTIRRVVSDYVTPLYEVSYGTPLEATDPGYYPAAIDSIVERILGHFGIDANFVPPRVIARHLIALSVRQDELFRALEGAMGSLVKDRMPFVRAYRYGWTVEQAYALPDSVVDQFIDDATL